MSLVPPPSVETTHEPGKGKISFTWMQWLFELYKEVTYASSFETITSTPVTAGSNQVILVDDDVAGATTVNLPAASGLGRVYYIKKIGSTADVTIDASGSEKIDDGLTATLTLQYEAIRIVSDGSNWWVL